MELNTSIRNDYIFGSIQNLMEQESPKQLRDKSDKFKSFLTAGEVSKTEKTDTIKEWIESIKVLKDRLEDETTEDSLKLYKDTLKNFLNYYTENDLYVKEVKVSDGQYYSKTINIIKAVDDKVDQLTDDLLKDQMGRLKILELTGQIQGMLFEIEA